jgi:hypothetical protein
MFDIGDLIIIDRFVQDVYSIKDISLFKNKLDNLFDDFSGLGRVGLYRAVMSDGFNCFGVVLSSIKNVRDMLEIASRLVIERKNAFFKKTLYLLCDEIEQQFLRAESQVCLYLKAHGYDILDVDFQNLHTACLRKYFIHEAYKLSCILQAHVRIICEKKHNSVLANTLKKLIPSIEEEVKLWISINLDALNKVVIIKKGSSAQSAFEEICQNFKEKFACSWRIENPMAEGLIQFKKLCLA